MLRRLLTVSLSLICFIGTILPLPGQAAIISTQQSLGAAERAGHLQSVQTWLKRDEVRAEMQAYGVAPELAAERVAALTDAELQQLSGQLGEQPAGGSALGVIGLVFVVLLVLELVGVINIFTRI